MGGGEGPIRADAASTNSARHLVSHPTWQEGAGLHTGEKVAALAPEGCGTLGLRGKAKPASQGAGVVLTEGEVRAEVPSIEGQALGTLPLELGRGPAGKEVRRAKGEERSHQTGRSRAEWHLTKGRPTVPVPWETGVES